jgi:hypothetical protein
MPVVAMVVASMAIVPMADRRLKVRFKSYLLGAAGRLCDVWVVGRCGATLASLTGSTSAHEVALGF